MMSTAPICIAPAGNGGRRGDMQTSGLVSSSESCAILGALNR